MDYGNSVARMLISNGLRMTQNLDLLTVMPLRPQKNLSVGEFSRNAAGAFIYPFRAYLLYTPKAQQSASNSLAKSATLNLSSIDGVAFPETMKIVIVDGKQESIDQTPAFNMLNTVLGPVKFRNGWFDMKGRKLNGKPTAKGVYYYNGKRIRIY